MLNIKAKRGRISNGTVSNGMKSRWSIKNFMKRRPYLVWYVKKPAELSDESIVEHTLNYGDWDDVQKLIAIMGIKKMARIFWRQTNRRRINYRPEIKNYFSFYFRKYA